MNVWIFVITALLTPRAPSLLAPITEPLGLSTQDLAPALVEGPPAPMSVAAPVDDEPRFHGLERMLAELDAANG